MCMVTKKSTKKTMKKQAKTTAVPQKATSHQKECCTMSSCKTPICKDTAGCIYFLGFVGAAVFYIVNATGFWNGVLGVLKALVWPAMLVFHLLGL